MTTGPDNSTYANANYFYYYRHHGVYRHCMIRRSLLRNATVLGAVGAAGLTAAGPADAALPAGMPAYRYLRDALRLPLRYNPTGEFIFPCIRGV